MKLTPAPLACGLFALFLGSVALAAGAPAAKDPARDAEANIRTAFAKSFPAVRIKSVGTTPWTGVYEAVTPEGIIYTDATGHYAINGTLVDVQTLANMTQIRQAELGRIDFAKLPFARAIKQVKGDGHRVMAVFADPDCPYCRKLETDLKDVDNVTIYTFLYPIDGLHPDASKHARAIWCAKDPAHAWTAWVADRVEPETAQCDGDPVREISALGDQLEIQGTPTIFLSDGKRIPGYLPREEIERELDGVPQATTRNN